MSGRTPYIKKPKAEVKDRPPKKKKHKAASLAATVAMAENAGMVYGEFVSNEYNKRTPRRTIPPNYISLNERKMMKLGKPVYGGVTTLWAALKYDCPNIYAKKVERQNALEALKAGKSLPKKQEQEQKGKKKCRKSRKDTNSNLLSLSDET